jgi:glycosyltransferase involved in cell wall biosynthesis
MVGERQTGNETYVVNLLRALLAQDGEVQVVPLTPRPAALDGPLGPDAVRRAVRIRPTPAWLRVPLGIPWAVYRHDLALVHVTYVAPPRCPAPTVVTVHDLSFAALPDTFSLRDRLILSLGVPRSARRAARVIAVSEFTRRDLVRRYGVPEDRIRVTHEAADPRFRPIENPDGLAAARRRHGLEGPYLLSVGNLQPRKNLGVLLEAFRAVRHEGRLPHRLVVVGQPGRGGGAVRAAACRFGLERDIVFTGYVPGDELAALYAGAALFAYPALYEGFGLPPLEAMACGAPVLASNTGALPEVLGDAAWLLDPRDPRAWAEAIRRVLTEPILAARWRAAGLARAARFTWERTARDTVAVYREALGDRVAHPVPAGG